MSERSQVTSPTRSATGLDKLIGNFKMIWRKLWELTRWNPLLTPALNTNLEPW